MIYDHLSRAALYERVSKHMHHAFTFLRRGDLLTIAKGRHEIAGEDAFAIVHEYDTKPAEQCKWEAHRKYIDVQFTITGAEGMGVAYVDQAKTTTDYDATKDFQLFTAQGDVVNVKAGYFVVFFPHDVHQPGVAVDAPALVRKVVVKVRVDN